jgi:hypothetical protein
MKCNIKIYLLKKLKGKEWNRLISLRTENSGGTLWTRSWTFGFLTGWGTINISTRAVLRGIILLAAKKNRLCGQVRSSYISQIGHYTRFKVHSYFFVHGAKTKRPRFGISQPKSNRRLRHHNRRFSAAKCAIFTSCLHYNLNTVLTIYVGHFKSSAHCMFFL